MSPQTKNLPRKQCFQKSFLFAAVAILPLLAIVIWLFSGLPSPTAQAASDINRQINYQGKIASSSGMAIVDGSYSFKFSFWSLQNGGTKLWEETWSTSTSKVAVTAGIFSAALGNYIDIPASVFSSDSVYLQVEFDPDGLGIDQTFLPRKRLTASPYAFNSDTLDGYNASTTAASGTIPVLTAGGGLTVGAVTTTDLVVLGDTNFATLTVTNLITNSLTTSSFASANVSQWFNDIGYITSTLGVTSSQWTTNGSDIYYNLGYVGIGTSSPIGPLHLVSEGVFPLVSDKYTPGSTNGIIFRSAKGSVASPTKATADFLLGAIFGRGYQEVTNEFSLVNTAAVGMYASEDYTDTAQGTYIAIGTTPNGSTTRSERMRIDNVGNVGIGITAPSTALEVAGTVSSTGLRVNGDGYIDGSLGVGRGTPGMYNSTFFSYASTTDPATTTIGSYEKLRVTLSQNSGYVVIGNGSALDIIVGTSTHSNYAAASYNNARVLGDGTGTIDVLIGSRTLVQNYSSSTIIDAYGLQVMGTSNIGGGTIANAYGIYLNDQTAGSSKNYQIYATGSAPSYFGGNIGIGVASPSTALEVAGTVSSTGLRIDNLNGLLYATSGSVGTTSLSILGVTSSQWTTNGSDIYYNAGKVGIGTMAPTHALDVYSTTTNFSGTDNLGLTVLYVTDPSSTTAGGLYRGARFRVQTADSAADYTNGIMGISPQVAHRGTGLVDEASGVYSSVSAESAGTITDAYAYRTYISAPVAGGVITNAYNYYGGGNPGTNNGSITNTYGFYMDDVVTTTNMYGFYGNIAAASNRWNLYMAGTADNYINGKVGIGTTTPSQQLSLTGNIDMPLTVGTSSPGGIIYKGGVPFISDFNYGFNGVTTTNGVNTFVGVNAGNLTMGSTATNTFQASYNTAVGYQALNNNTVGSNNTAIGVNAIYFNTTGKDNTANGVSALHDNTDGSYNTAMGYTALYSNDVGSYNTALGYNAGRYWANGVTPLDLANQSIYIGAESMGLNNSDDNSIVIGYAAKGIGANSVVLGNDNILTTALKGNVGIGTTSPAVALDIYGNADNTLEMSLFNPNEGTSSRSMIKFGHSSGGNYGALWHTGNSYANASQTNWLANQTVLLGADTNGLMLASTQGPLRIAIGNYITRFVVATSGNVGIGVNDPTAKLEVVGTISSSALRIDNLNGLLYATSGSVGTTSLSILGVTSSQWITNGSDIYYNTGNVGIGTTTPNALLAIQGNASTSPLLNIMRSTTSTALFIDSIGRIGIGTNTPSRALQIYADVDATWIPFEIDNVSTGTNAAARIALAVGTATSYISQAGSGNSLTPGLLQISGSNDVAILAGGTRALTAETSGQVGIGTSSPSNLLHVYTNSNTTQIPLMVENASTGANVEARIALTAGTATSYINQIGSGNVGSNTPGLLQIAGSNDVAIFTGGSNSLMVKTNGNVGIGTSTPSQQLSITGNFSMPLTVGTTSPYGIIYKGGTRFISDFNFGFNGVTTTNGFNTFVGVNAGNLTMGSTATNTYQASNNTAIGTQALYSNSIGFYNTAIGSRALQDNTDGYQNTAVGSNALRFNTTGDNNVAQGFQSLYLNTSGFFNTGVGRNALYHNTIGDQNTALGGNSMFWNDIGSSNTAIGINALFGLSGLNYGNTALGNNAGRFQADGVTLLGSSSRSIYIGADSMGLNDSDDNSIVIGYGAKGIGANSVVLGNDDILTTALKGSVGIGTSPSVDYPLYVSTTLDDPTISNAIGIYNVRTVRLSATSGASSFGFRNINRLELNDAISATGTMVASYNVSQLKGYGAGTASNLTGVRSLVINDSSSTLNSAYTLYADAITNTDGGTVRNAYGLYLGNQTVGTNVNYSIYSAGGDNYFGGNMGIGITAPSTALEVVGTISSTALRIDNLTGLLYATNGLVATITTSSLGLMSAVTDNWVDTIGDTMTGSLIVSNTSHIDVASSSEGYWLGGARVLSIPSDNNIAIGRNTLSSLALGTNNMGLGYAALYNNTDGSDNSAIGVNALYNNTIGSSNTAIGTFSLRNNVNGGSNTAIGSSALNDNINGSYNIANGSQALNKALGSFNTAIGVSAGSLLISGDFNVFLGYSAGISIATGTGNIIIGNSASGLGSTTNNFLNIGDAIYGDLANGNVGIGVTNPSTAFEVAGTVSSSAIRVEGNGVITGNLLIGVTEDPWLTSSDFNLYSMASTSNPTSTRIANYLKGRVSLTQNNGNALVANYSVQDIYVGTSTQSSYVVAGYNQARALGSGTGTVNLLIGTRSYAQNYSSSTVIDAYGLHIMGASNIGGGSITNAYGIYLNDQTAGSSKNYQIYATGSAPSYFGGNIGIGVTNPTAKLEVAGLVSSTYINVASTTLGYWLGGQRFISIPSASSTAVGVHALDNVTASGQRNTAIGAYALQNTTNGSENAGLGYYALRTNTTGVNNTAIGTFALQNNINGNGNTALGWDALYSNTSGTNNIAVGVGTLYYNTEGSYNEAFGQQTLFNNTTGNYNVAIGHSALQSNTTGNYNLGLGWGANVSTGTLSKAIAIGYNALVSTSSAMVLGGTGADAVKVGIGVTAPSTALEVVGTISSTALRVDNLTGFLYASGGLVGTSTLTGASLSGLVDGQLLFGSATGSIAQSSNLNWNSASSTLSIGTTTVAKALTIATNNTAGQISLFSNGTGASGYAGMAMYNNVGSLFNMGMADDTNSVRSPNDGFIATNNDLVFYTNNAYTEQMRILANGNVGIGSSSPSSRLVVANGDMAIDNGNLYLGDGDFIFRQGDLSSKIRTDSVDGADNEVLILTAAGDNGTSRSASAYLYGNENGGFSGDMLLSAGASLGKIRLETNGIERLTILPNGNIGIGTTTPQAMLMINSDNTSTPLLKIATTTNQNIFNVNANGTVSIGHSDDYYKFDVYGGSVRFANSSSDHRIYAVNYDTSGLSGLVAFAATGTLTTADSIRVTRVGNDFSGAGSDGFLATSTGVVAAGENLVNGLTLAAIAPNAPIRFFVGSSSAAYERMRITSNGSVGIGTTTPIYKLDVNVSANGMNGIRSFNGSTGISAQSRIISQTDNVDAQLISYGNNYASGTHEWSGRGVLMSESGSSTGIAIGVLNATGDIRFYTGTVNPSSTSSRMTISSNGDVGIGTTTPDSKLTVYSGTAGDLFHIYNSNYPNIMRVSNNGAVSIGTSTGSFRLNTYGTSVLFASSSGDMRVYSRNYDTSAIAEFLAGSSGSADDNLRMLGIGNNYTDSGTFSSSSGAIVASANQVNGLSLSALSTSGPIRFYTGADNYTQRMTISAAGNVGIGTSTPAASLSIYKASPSAGESLLLISTSTGNVFRFSASGTAYAANSWQSGNADYAEYYYSRDSDLTSGEAVCVDVTKNNAVVRCTRAGDDNIMGIVSTRPAIVGNSKVQYENNPSYKIIAMLGQIPARASNENGDIRPGDYLTAASVPGYVMKAGAGDATVGVALENLTVDTGTINVMISRRNKSLTVEQVEEAVTKRITDMELEDEVNIMLADSIKNYDFTDDIASYINPFITTIDTKLALLTDTLSLKVGELASSTLGADTNLSNQILAANDLISMLAQESSTTANNLSVTAAKVNDLDTVVMANDTRLSALELFTSSSISDIQVALAGLSVSTSSALKVDNNSLTVNTLAVVQAADFIGTITVRGEANFLSKVTFAADAEFKGHLIADKDTAGTAMIIKYATSTTVAFNTPYERIPKIVANLQASGTPVFATFAIADKTANGFSIILPVPAEEDLYFDWFAIATNYDGETAMSQSTDPIVEEPVIPEQQPEITDTSTPLELPVDNSSTTIPTEEPVVDAGTADQSAPVDALLQPADTSSQSAPDEAASSDPAPAETTETPAAEAPSESAAAALLQ